MKNHGRNLVRSTSCQETARPLSADEEYYLDCWKKILGGLLRWPEIRVIRWSRSYALAGPQADGLLTHVTPAWYVTGLLVPKRLRTQLNRHEWNGLHGEVEWAIEQSRSPDYPSTDRAWQAVRAKIRTIVRRYEAR